VLLNLETALAGFQMHGSSPSRPFAGSHANIGSLTGWLGWILAAPQLEKNVEYRGFLAKTLDPVLLPRLGLHSE